MTRKITTLLSGQASFHCACHPAHPWVTRTSSPASLCPNTFASTACRCSQHLWPFFISDDERTADRISAHLGAEPVLSEAEVEGLRRLSRALKLSRLCGVRAARRNTELVEVSLACRGSSSSACAPWRRRMPAPARRSELRSRESWKAALSWD